MAGPWRTLPDRARTLPHKLNERCRIDWLDEMTVEASSHATSPIFLVPPAGERDPCRQLPLNSGEVGWFVRAGRLLDEGQLDCVVRGYLLIPVAIMVVATPEVITTVQRPETSRDQEHKPFVTRTAPQRSERSCIDTADQGGKRSTGA